jgi:hypothetical protein
MQADSSFNYDQSYEGLAPSGAPVILPAPPSSELEIFVPSSVGGSTTHLNAPGLSPNFSAFHRYHAGRLSGYRHPSGITSDVGVASNPFPSSSSAPNTFGTCNKTSEGPLLHASSFRV